MLDKSSVKPGKPVAAERPGVLADGDGDGDV